MLRAAVEKPRQWQWISRQPGVGLPPEDVERQVVGMLARLSHLRIVLRHPDDVDALPERFFLSVDSQGKAKIRELFYKKLATLPHHRAGAIQK
jgi:hypothetical protein